MGGTGAAYQFTRQLLEAGKNVCTSNKELVAKHGAEFLELAVARHCNYMFEASVGGGIPIIRSVNTALTAEKIEAVTAILNGTTNYILTKMGSEGTEYEEALKQAQELGYAERNPEADVEGYDACRKLAILSSLITGRNVDAGEIYTEGITGITGADFEYARLEGMVIKQLAIGKMQEDGSVLAMVAPFMLSAGYPLAAVNDVFNAVLVTGNMLGDVIFYGRGAGKLPTASAVAADVIDCAKHQGKNVICIWDREAAKVADVADTKRRFFLRVDAEARGAVEEMFAGGKIVTLPAGGEELGFFTAEMKEKDFNAKCGELGTAVLSRIRLL